MYDFDVISIGAGSGGCASAMRCADLGKRVALVEYRKKGTGGTCVNRGCIPTKVLVKCAQAYSEAKEAKKFGIIVDNVKANHDLIQQKKQTVINNLSFGLDNLLIKPRKIERFWGKAKLIDAHTIEVSDGEEKKKITSENIIIATGSEPAMIGAFNIDREKIITSDEALNLKEIPEDMIIVGAGALGLEFAYIFSAYGCRITIVEMMPHVVPLMTDKDITDAVQQHLKKNNIDVRCGSGIGEIIVNETGKVICRFQNGEFIEAEKALVAIGRSLNTKDMGLQDIGIEVNVKGQIIVDDQLRTSLKNIYAVGDIVAGPQLSHKAQKEGISAAETICGMKNTINYNVMPWAIFMQPEIAAVGLTALDAEGKGIETLVGKMPFYANEKAITMQNTTGLIKLVARKDNHKIIGGQIFGVDASILIAEIAVAIEKELTIEDLANSIHAHPTLSEIVMETAKNALGKAFHK